MVAVSAQIFYTTPGMKGMMSQLLVCVAAQHRADAIPVQE